jgi:hypothetical protein
LHDVAQPGTPSPSPYPSFAARGSGGGGVTMALLTASSSTLRPRKDSNQWSSVTALLDLQPLASHTLPHLLAWPPVRAGRLTQKNSVQTILHPQAVTKSLRSVEAAHLSAPSAFPLSAASVAPGETCKHSSFKTSCHRVHVKAQS